MYLASFNRYGASVCDFEEPDAEGTMFDFNLPSESNHMEFLMVSYSLFEFFKVIIGGFLLSSKLMESSKKMFLQIRNINVGFKLIEYKLSFMYEDLHTKVAVVSSRIGIIFHLSSFCFIVGAFILFHFLVDKDKYGGFEVSLTYALLIGALGVDTIFGIQLIFSDWILVSNGFKMFRKYVPEFVLKQSRWCGSVSQYNNMIDYCLDEHWIWNCNLPECVRGMVEKIKIMLFSSSNNDIEELKCLILEELTKRSCKEKLDSSFLYMSSSETDSFEYAEKVLELHLATEICYHSQTEMESNDYTEERKRARRMCKTISDCLFYLLMMKPEMLAPILKGNWQLAFQDTFEETKEHLMNHQISDLIKACNEFMNVEGQLKLKESSGSKSVLLKACNQGREIKTKWEETSDRWFIFFCFGAVKCRPLLHAQQTSRGGELMTFTRFLMQHLGLVPGDKTEQELYSSRQRPYMYMLN